MTLLARIRHLSGLVYDLARGVARRLPAKPTPLHVLSDLHHLQDSLANASEDIGYGGRHLTDYLNLGLSWLEHLEGHLANRSWEEARGVLTPDALAVVRTEIAALRDASLGALDNLRRLVDETVDDEVVDELLVRDNAERGVAQMLAAIPAANDIADDSDGLVGPPESDVLGTVGRYFGREEEGAVAGAQLVPPEAEPQNGGGL
ncbi:hypothetical protein OV203_32300 [Nannocystis sp. ILAH1]|uniref:hypothetical protein n=1 Tax=Nannocystis sp. ILAH1 TaxID=2996789 RepID=UPI00227019A4|nr:hypothetical protein [Nannocystis sp. ILAH1]MCY0991865.1 hypothetical protein [Nannocystis sp. ILAH1]